MPGVAAGLSGHDLPVPFLVIPQAAPIHALLSAQQGRSRPVHDWLSLRTPPSLRASGCLLGITGGPGNLGVEPAQLIAWQQLVEAEAS